MCIYLERYPNDPGKLTVENSVEKYVHTAVLLLRVHYYLVKISLERYSDPFILLSFEKNYTLTCPTFRSISTTNNHQTMLPPNEISSSSFLRHCRHSLRHSHRSPARFTRTSSYILSSAARHFRSYQCLLSSISLYFSLFDQCYPVSRFQLLLALVQAACYEYQYTLMYVATLSSTTSP